MPEEMIFCVLSLTGVFFKYSNIQRTANMDTMSCVKQRNSAVLWIWIQSDPEHFPGSGIIVPDPAS